MDVVLDPDGQAEDALETIADRDLAMAEIERTDQQPTPAVHGTLGTHPDPRDRSLVTGSRGQQVTTCPDCIVHDVVGPGRPPLSFHDATYSIDEPGQDLGSANVDADKQIAGPAGLITFRHRCSSPPGSCRGTDSG